jgi:hypothetical protein
MFLAPVANKNTILYISGPMTGVVDHNAPAFDAVERFLIFYGYRPINPANNDGRSRDKPWHFYMSLDIVSVCQSNALILLPDWEFSKGAVLEIAVAERLETPIYEITNFKDFINTPEGQTAVLEVELITPRVTVKAERKDLTGRVKCQIRGLIKQTRKLLSLTQKKFQWS